MNLMGKKCGTEPSADRDGTTEPGEVESVATLQHPVN